MPQIKGHTLGWIAAAALLATAGTGMGFGPGPKKVAAPVDGVKASTPAIGQGGNDEKVVPPGPDAIDAGAPIKGVAKMGTRVENNGAGLFDTPPYHDPAFELYAEQLRAENDPNHLEFAPSAPGHDPTAMFPLGPETKPPPAMTEAAGDFRIWRNRSLDGDIGGSASFSDRSNEPSLGGLDDTVFWSGNWYAARSLNRGVSFQYVDPYDNFPANGVTDIPAGASSFCCDQVVAHSTNFNLTIWLLQYSVNGSSNNVQRIAVANGATDLKDNNWSYWDFSAQDFGFPSGNWNDFPDIMCTTSYAFFSTNVFNSADAYQGSVVWAIPLADLSAGGGISYYYYSRTDGTRRLCQGSTATGWFAHHVDTDTVGLWNWLGDSTSASVYNVNHNALGNGSMAFNGPGGCNWMGRADNRILGAARGAGTDILLMWMSSPQGGITAPYTQTLRIRESDRAVLAQDTIYNNSGPWCYPSVAANAAGDYGGVITWGTTTDYPSPWVFLADNYNSKNLQGAELIKVGTGTTCQSVNRWGDYLTTRRSTLGANNFISASFFNNANGTQPLYTWFGREDDEPGPDIASETLTVPGGIYDPGDPIVASYSARNIGSSTSSNDTVEIRLSTNTIISAGDALMGSVLRGAFSPGVGFSGNVNAGIPPATADGTYYVGVIHQTTPDNFFANNYNDYTTTPPSIQVLSRPDIDVTNVQWIGVPSRKVGIGQQIPWFSFKWDNHNTGTKVSNYDIDVRASTNTIISLADTQLVYYAPGALGPLAAGGSTTWNNNFFNMPPSMTPGLYYLGIITSDPNDSDTSNNTAYDAVRINVQWCDVDFDRDGSVDLIDFFQWFAWFDAGNAKADIDGNPGLDLGDYFFFFQAWDNSCFAVP